MTCRERVKIEYPGNLSEHASGGCLLCPDSYGYLPKPKYCTDGKCDRDCRKCWDREIPETEVVDGTVTITVDENGRVISSTEDGQHILDSGARREFETGAVRDIQEGKGRCDLMPLEVISSFMFDEVINKISSYQADGSVDYLYDALDAYIYNNKLEVCDVMLEVAKHFEAGAKKYGEYNWQKGIPTHCYIDSAVRHYLKLLRGDKDEPHDRAFVWNILCCIWTCEHKPELNDYAKGETTTI